MKQGNLIQLEIVIGEEVMEIMVGEMEEVEVMEVEELEMEEVVGEI